MDLKLVALSTLQLIVTHCAEVAEHLKHGKGGGEGGGEGGGGFEGRADMYILAQFLAR